MCAGGMELPNQIYGYKSMGAPGAWKVPLLYLGDAELCFLHTVHLFM